MAKKCATTTQSSLDNLCGRRERLGLAILAAMPQANDLGDDWLSRPALKKWAKAFARLGHVIRADGWRKALDLVPPGRNYREVKRDKLLDLLRLATDNGDALAIANWLDGTYNVRDCTIHDALTLVLAEEIAAADVQRQRNATPASPAESIIYADLDQMAAVVNRSKSCLEKLKRRKTNPLPEPDAAGGGGKKDEWLWSRVRPWLETEFNKHFAETLPRRL
jgi:hypothetical protein